MKRQTGVRVEASLWEAYRELCRRQKLRSSQPIEDFLMLAVDEGSAMSLLRLMREAAKTRTEGHEAYARVLLEWYKHGKFWVHGLGGDEVAVETLLLEALKTVVDGDLRGQIEEALIARQRETYSKEKDANKS